MTYQYKYPCNVVAKIRNIIVTKNYDFSMSIGDLKLSRVIKNYKYDMMIQHISSYHYNFPNDFDGSEVTMNIDFGLRFEEYENIHNRDFMKTLSDKWKFECPDEHYKHPITGIKDLDDLIYSYIDTVEIFIEWTMWNDGDTVCHKEILTNNT